MQSKQIAPESKFRLNPLFRVRFGPPVQCDLLLDGASVELPDYRYLQFMARVADDRSFAELSGDVAEIFAVGKDHADRIVEDLITHKLLTPHDRIYPELPAVKHWVDRGWLDGLILHLRSRDMVFADSHAEDPEAYQDILLSRCLQEEGMPAVWKEYPDRPYSALPAPGKLPEDETFEAVLLRRRSNLPWQRRTIDLQTLSDILHYANIETRRLRMAVEHEGMTRPSVLLNSAFSALETYCFALAVDGLTPGVYHYDPRHHGVTQIRSDLRRDELDRMCTGQGRPRNAACAFVISAVWHRYMFRYRHPRAYRTLLINVAELGHKYILLATALRFHTFLTPTLHDQYADSLLGVDGFEEAPLYVVAIG